MNRYKYTLALEVDVDAFDIFDADDIVEDNFGVGENAGAVITRMKVVDVQSTDN